MDSASFAPERQWIDRDLQCLLPSLLRDGKRPKRTRQCAPGLTPTHLNRRYVVASRIIPNRCAVCGRAGRNVFQFHLLSEACRHFHVPLKLPSSTFFHEPCSRRAYRALTKRPVVAFLQGGIK